MRDIINSSGINLVSIDWIGIDMNEESPLWKRLAWMAGIWLASVMALGLVSFLLRLWIKS